MTGITLPKTGWSVTGGVAAYTHPAGPSSDGQGNPCWYASGAWSGTVMGVAIVYNGKLQHYADLTDPQTSALTTFVAAAGKSQAINISDLLGG